MSLITGDRRNTKRCKGCGKPKTAHYNNGVRTFNSNNSTGLCDSCLQLENAKSKRKKK